MRGLLPERFLEGLGFMGTCVSQNKSLGHACTQIGSPEKILDNWLKCVIIKL